jgi:ubiquinone/menaquinone biosynthesis C-methylase UbiE
LRRVAGANTVADMTSVPQEVLQHYAEVDEGARIVSGLRQLELVRTQQLIRRFLPEKPLDIADVGGATGVHASWLAEDGHHVHLVDPAPGHVEAARALSPSAGSVEATLGVAAELPFDDGSMDAVLLLGPMYHLTEAADRVAALRESLRVGRPGAPLFVAAISRYASLFDGLGRKMLFEPGFRSIVEGDLRDGRHLNPTNHPHWFTTAYLTHPDGLRAEAEEAGVDVDAVFGVEGIADYLPSLDDDWEIPARREAIIWAAEQTETEPSLAGLSSHLLLVGHKPE